MKRLFTLILAVICLTGCEQMIIDWIPVTFMIKVQDSYGHDMLDPANDNTWLIGTEISFRGQSDVLDENDLYPQTKMLLPEYEGFRIEKGDGYYYIAFGEFMRRDNDRELLTIRWPDGSTNEISYKCRLIESKIKANETFELDGVKCSNPIAIVK